MKCPKCGFEQDDESKECLKCGIIFEKYLKRQEYLKNLGQITSSVQTYNKEANQKPRIIEVIKNLVLFVNPDTNPVSFGGRALVFLIVLIWGIKFIFTPMESSYVGMRFLHLVNLPFHEAGHIFFMPFGSVIRSLGGSLMQILMPAICMVVFLIKTRDTFGAGICLWWVAENFMDIAPYINDASILELPLLGGVTGDQAAYGYHDWEFILTELKLIKYDHSIAVASYNIGIVLMLISFIWMGYILFKQLKNLIQKQMFE